MSFTFGQPVGSAASTGTTGLLNNVSSAANPSTITSAAPGLSFGTQPTAAAASTGGTALGGGFSFGTSQLGADNQKKTVSFNIAGAAANTPASLTTQAAAPTLSTLLGGSTATTSSLPVVSTTSTPLGSGFKLGGTGGTLPATSAGGASFGLQPSAGLSFGLGSNVSSAATTTTGTTGLFGTTPASVNTPSTIQGLGGVASTSGSTAVGVSKTCDTKAVKELIVPPEIVATVDSFTKYVKTQKCVRENIARMSSKPLYRVQDDIKNLRQQLLLVTSGLQRNAATIDRLKRDTVQELKYAEIAQRTRDTPPGLQYENTGPSEYFQGLADEFEVQMQLYRQQIAELENHLESADRAAALTPQELSLLLGKLNEGFIALAAQLQVVHESVKEVKESYAAYRRTVFGDSSDIFDRRQRVTDASKKPVTTPCTVGPTPFATMSNSASLAMAAAINRNQPAVAAPGFGLSCGGTSSLGTGTLSNVLGNNTLFGQTASGTNTGFSLGSTGGTSFGAPSTTTQSSFGSTPSLAGTFGGVQSTGGGLFGQSPANPSGGLFGSAATGLGSPQTFPLAKTPIGSKRGKNA